MEIKILKIQIQKIKIGEIVHFEVTDVIRTVKYCNFSSYIMKLQYLKCILTRFFFQKSKLKKPSFQMRFTNPALSVFKESFAFRGYSKFTLSFEHYKFRKL